jgi:hypothetical protein
MKSVPGAARDQAVVVSAGTHSVDAVLIRSFR